MKFQISVGKATYEASANKISQIKSLNASCIFHRIYYGCDQEPTTRVGQEPKKLKTLIWQLKNTTVFHLQESSPIQPLKNWNTNEQDWTLSKTGKRRHSRTRAGRAPPPQDRTAVCLSANEKPASTQSGSNTRPDRANPKSSGALAHCGREDNSGSNCRTDNWAERPSGETNSLSGKNENQRWNLAGIPARERERSTRGNLPDVLDRAALDLRPRTKLRASSRRNISRRKQKLKRQKTETGNRAPGSLLTQKFHTKKIKQRTQRNWLPARIPGTEKQNPGAATQDDLSGGKSRSARENE
jgi:hypothetical protein